MQNAIDAIAEVNKKPLFTTKPDHKVRKATVLQLKSILRGKKRITTKKSVMNKASRKKVARSFKDSDVVWNTEANGLNYFKSVYGQNT